MIAVLIALRGLYYDYSDAYLHAILAFGIALMGLFWPKASCLVGTALLAVTLAAGLLAPDAKYFAIDLRAGMSRSEIVKRLGTPDIIAASPREMTELKTGYSKPSPWRFRQVGPVEVYTRGERALWLFYRENGELAYYFVGGS